MERWDLGGARLAACACALALAGTAACGVQLDGDGGGGGGGGGKPDAPPPPPIDAPPLPPCTGGDAAMRSPDGSCFVLFSARVTHADARAACAARGSRLAFILNAQDDQTARTLAGTRDVFFGLTDVKVEGTFVFTDDSIPTYTNWYMNEPNDGGGAYAEDCAVINGVRGGAWDDRPCAPDPNAGGGLYAYLCES